MNNLLYWESSDGKRKKMAIRPKGRFGEMVFYIRNKTRINFLSLFLKFDCFRKSCVEYYEVGFSDAGAQLKICYYIRVK